jgi:hypothetical protein
MKNIIYVDASTDQITFDQCCKFKAEALPTFKILAQHQLVTRPDGRQVKIAVKINEFAKGSPSFENASARKISDTEYCIDIGIGLIARISIMGRAIATDPSVLRGHKGIILDKTALDSGHSKVLGDFAFHYVLSLLFWHEVAHIVLGHVDWVAKTNGTLLREFKNSSIQPIYLETRRALEADADRIAGKWFASVADLSLRDNSILKYVSTKDVFFDIGYFVGSFFQLTESLDNELPDTNKVHPNALKRTAVVWSFIDEYLQQYHPSSYLSLQKAVYAGGFEAFKHIIHTNKSDFNLLEIADFIAGCDAVIKRSGVRGMQFSMVKSGLSSFVFE